MNLGSPVVVAVADHMYIKKFFITAFLLFLSYSIAEESIGLQLFDFAERVLIEDYINPKQLSIPKIVNQYRENLLKNCKNMISCGYKEAKPIIQEMLDSFGDPHLEFYDFSDPVEGDVGDHVGTGRFGMWLRSTEKSLFVIDSYQNSPAYKAGIRVGDIIETVNSKPSNPLSLQKQLRELEISFAETALVVNRKGKRIAIRMRPTYSTFLYPLLDKLNDSVFRIKIYDLDLLLQDQLVHDLIISAKEKGAKGVILDLRYNEGGTMVASLKIASAFFRNPSEISVEKNGARFIFRYDNGQVEWQTMGDANHKGSFEGTLRNPTTFDGAVTVLTTARTLSAGEHLAYLIQAAKRGIVIGEPTAGALDTSVKSKEFPGGGTLRYSATRYQNLQGQWLPPRVTPDVTITDFSSGYASGQDNVLNEAVKRLTTKIK